MTASRGGEVVREAAKQTRWSSLVSVRRLVERGSTRLGGCWIMKMAMIMMMMMVTIMIKMVRIIMIHV